MPSNTIALRCVEVHKYTLPAVNEANEQRFRVKSAESLYDARAREHAQGFARHRNVCALVFGNK